ncbi:MAG TPA: flavodoxin family protein [Spirochaetes bacterium]|nr:flavodoxin family protein [Spirochaetota bacterium]
MKAVVVCGSPRVKGNTQMILETACDVLKENGVDTELVLLHNKFIKPCIACEKCKQLKDRTCSIKDDDFHPVLEKIIGADAFIIGSPVYFGCATSQTTSLLHRAGYVARQNNNFLKGKVGGPVVVARRAGQNFTYAQLVFFFTINEMIVPGSTYWNIAFGRKKGEVVEDEEGMDTVRTFAANVAGLLYKIKQ